jgi:hypothetical protein
VEGPPRSFPAVRGVIRALPLVSFIVMLVRHRNGKLLFAYHLV